MASRDEVNNWLKENYSIDDRYMFSDSGTLKFCIQNGKIEFVPFFNSNAWNDEIVDVYINYIKDNEVSFDRIGDVNHYQKEIMEKFLELGYLNHFLKVSSYFYDWTDEIIKKFIEKMDSCKIEKSLFSAKNNFRENPLILDAAIKNKQYSIINSFYHSAWTPENEKKFGDIAVDFVQQGYDESSMTGIFDHPYTYMQLVKNGIYKYVFRINYVNSESRNEILNSEVNQEIFISAFNDMKEEKRIFNNEVFTRNSKFLSKVLEGKDLNFINNLGRFYKSAWSKENKKTYADNFMKDDVLVKAILDDSYCLSVALDKKFFHFLYWYDNEAWSKENMNKYFNMWYKDRTLRTDFIRKPYFKYKTCYLTRTIRKLERVSISRNIEIDDGLLSNEKILYSLGEKVVNGESSFGVLNDKLFSFIYQVNSYRTTLLLRSLIDDKFENINKLFDENGITDYLYNNLLFDYDYREYCLQNNIDFFSNCTDKVHLQYLQFVSKYPELCKSIYISIENVDKYFDHCGIKVDLLEELFKPDSIRLLSKITQEIEEPCLSDKKKLVVEKMNSFDSEKIGDSFYRFVSSRFDELTEEKINEFYKLVRRIENSNSSEIRAFGEMFADLVLQHENPDEKLEEIEKIFIQDNVPFVGKIYSVFKKLHPNYDYAKYHTQLSPVLMNATEEEKDRIIFMDLLKIELGSNNRNLQKYLISFYNCNMMYDLIKNGTYKLNDFSDSKLKEFDLYAKRIKFLCENVLDINLDISENYNNSFEYVSIIEKKIRENNNFDNIPDFLVSNICRGTQFNTLLDMITYSVSKTKKADLNNRNNSVTGFKLEKGDCVKGIRDIVYLPNILQNGSVAAEFLGDSANSDLTPLDTDLSLVIEEGKTIKDTMSKLKAYGYGSTYLVLKGDERFDITRTNEGTRDDVVNNDKIELFNTCEKDHYGIRTGFASSEIDFILSNDSFEKIGFELVLSGFYIPVVDMDGNLRFSPDDYDTLRSKMDGLSHYGIYSYNLSENLIDDDILMIQSELKGNKEEADDKRNAIFDSVSDVLEEFGVSIKKQMDGDIENGTMEFLDTGSTGRGTNVANDSDFDFIVRVDRELFFDEERFSLVKKKMLDKFGKATAGEFRLKDVYLEGIDDPLKIDMTFITKTNKLDYSTEVCIKDRLDTIKTLYPEQYDLVVANIVFAKKFFKEAGCYKPKHAGENPQGGLGGVGTETWILQHGGSFYDAAVDFVECAELYPNLADFQKNYSIQDFGKNHLAEKRGHYPYDNFVYNLNDEGFTKIKDALKGYVDSKKVVSTTEISSYK